MEFKERKICREIAQAFENGMTVKRIIQLFSEDYMAETGKKLGTKCVNACISKYCSEKRIRENDENLTREILEMESNGLKKREISDRLGICISKVYSLNHTGNIAQKRVTKDNESIKPSEIEYLKENVKPGDCIRMAVRKFYRDQMCREQYKKSVCGVKIMSVHKNIVITSFGCMSWGEMAGYIKEEKRMREEK